MADLSFAHGHVKSFEETYIKVKLEEEYEHSLKIASLSMCLQRYY